MPRSELSYNLSFPGTYCKTLLCSLFSPISLEYKKDDHNLYQWIKKRQHLQVVQLFPHIWSSLFHIWNRTQKCASTFQYLLLKTGNCLCKNAHTAHSKKSSFGLQLLLNTFSWFSMLHSVFQTMHLSECYQLLSYFPSPKRFLILFLRDCHAFPFTIIYGWP